MLRLVMFVISNALVVTGLWEWPEKPKESDWSSFRNGGSSMSPLDDLPLKWSPTDGIAWQVELEGYGQSAPVLWDDSVYVTSVVGPRKDELKISCLSLTSGRMKWSQRFNSQEHRPSNYMQSRAAPTPTVDKDGVYAFFESGDLIAISHSGDLRWRKNFADSLGPFQNGHGLGTSPAQNDPCLFLNLEHKGPSFLVAVDKQSGDIVWQKERPSSSSWSSPIVFHLEGKEQVVVSSAGSICGYLATTGEMLWEVKPVVGNSVPSPTVHNSEIVIGARLPEFGSPKEAAKSNLCLQFDSEGNPHVKWRSVRALADYASPVVVDSCAYIVDKNGILHCLDFETGERHYSQRLQMEVWATPIVQVGKVYVCGKNGIIKVIQSGPIFQELASNQLWDPEAPPQPEQYREFYESETASDSNDGNSRKERALSRMMDSDANGDGRLEANELAGEMKGALAQFDEDQDGILSPSEIEKMAESFVRRRSVSRQSSRDPIAYAISAGPGKLLVRTGTRLYCISD